MLFQNIHTGEICEGRKDAIKGTDGVFLKWWPDGGESWQPAWSFYQHWKEIPDPKTFGVEKG